MASWCTVRSVVFLALMLGVRTQIFDIFQGYQPVVQSYPTVSTITHRKHQYQFIYSPSEVSTERKSGYRDPGNTYNVGNRDHYPNILKTSFDNGRATTTTTTAKPTQRYSSQSANRNGSNNNNSNKNTNSHKRRTQGHTQEDNSNEFWNFDSIKKKKPSNEDASNNYFADTFYAIRPLYKITTKAPVFESSRESNNDYYNTRPNQKHNKQNRHTTSKSVFNNESPGFNNDDTNYNSYTTAKPTLNNDRTDLNNNNYYNRETTVKPTYNNERQGFNNDEINYNSYTTAKPALNNDRTDLNSNNYYNRQTTLRPTYNNDRQGFNNDEINHNSYTTAKPVFNNDRTNYNKQTTAKPYNNERPVYNNYSPSKPSYNNDATNFNYKPNQNNHRTDFDSFDHSFNSYTTKDYQRPEYEHPTTRKHNNGRPYNTYNTESPFHNRPGVKPAVIQGPPITNRPITPRPGYNNHFGHADDSILFPEDPDMAPQVVYGPDVDKFSDSARRRFIELSEKMCDRYKSLDISQVAAIPLLPAPEPVTFNVSDCNPLSTPLIVGGKVVNIEEFPHNAAIGWQKLEGGGYSWKCGGSLISELFVLTAAHCSFQERDNSVVSGPPRVVQLGSSYLNDPGALVVRVTKAIRHPKYKLPKSYYDIALLKLGSAVRFSQVIKPACLGVPPKVGDSIIATGWGRTEYGGESSPELRGVSIPIWAIDQCYRVLGTSRKLPDGPRSDSQICAGEVQGKKDTCQGDSGGPAQIQDGCAWRIVGVTSLGRACGAPKTPAIYATIQREFVAAVLDEYR